VWRIARLTALSDDYSAYEDDVFKIFSRGDVVVASEALVVLHPNLARRYLVNVLTCGNDRAFINGIDAIERHGFETDDPLIGTCLNNVTSPPIVHRIIALPVKFLTTALLLKLVDSPEVGKQAAAAAMNSRFFPNLLPKLMEGQCAGCELNALDFDVFTKHQPIAYGFLGALLREGHELLKPATVAAICNLDAESVLTKVVYPRLTEKGSWRSRYNAIAVFRAIMAKGAAAWDDATEFLVALGMDHVYAVREAAFAAFALCPDPKAVCEPFFEIAEGCDDLQRTMVRQFLMQTKELIVQNYDREKIEAAMKLVGFQSSSYFP
jgi:hypothetical protein